MWSSSFRKRSSLSPSPRATSESQTNRTPPRTRKGRSLSKTPPRVYDTVPLSHTSPSVRELKEAARLEQIDDRDVDSKGALERLLRFHYFPEEFAAETMTAQCNAQFETREPDAVQSSLVAQAWTQWSTWSSAPARAIHGDNNPLHPPDRDGRGWLSRAGASRQSAFPATGPAQTSSSPRPSAAPAQQTRKVPKLDLRGKVLGSQERDGGQEPQIAQNGHSSLGSKVNSWHPNSANVTGNSSHRSAPRHSGTSSFDLNGRSTGPSLSNRDRASDPAANTSRAGRPGSHRDVQSSVGMTQAQPDTETWSGSRTPRRAGTGSAIASTGGTRNLKTGPRSSASGAQPSSARRVPVAGARGPGNPILPVRGESSSSSSGVGVQAQRVRECERGWETSEPVSELRDLWPTDRDRDRDRDQDRHGDGRISGGLGVDHWHHDDGEEGEGGGAEGVNEGEIDLKIWEHTLGRRDREEVERLRGTVEGLYAEMLVMQRTMSFLQTENKALEAQAAAEREAAAASQRSELQARGEEAMQEVRKRVGEEQEKVEALRGERERREKEGEEAGEEVKKGREERERLRALVKGLEEERERGEHQRGELRKRVAELEREKARAAEEANLKMGETARALAAAEAHWKEARQQLEARVHEVEQEREQLQMTVAALQDNFRARASASPGPPQAASGPAAVNLNLNPGRLALAPSQAPSPSQLPSEPWHTVTDPLAVQRTDSLSVQRDRVGSSESDSEEESDVSELEGRRDAGQRGARHLPSDPRVQADVMRTVEQGRAAVVAKTPSWTAQKFGEAIGKPQPAPRAHGGRGGGGGGGRSSVAGRGSGPGLFDHMLPVPDSERQPESALFSLRVAASTTSEQVGGEGPGSDISDLSQMMEEMEEMEREGGPTSVAETSSLAWSSDPEEEMRHLGLG